MRTTHTQICVHVKDPISICRKRVDLTAGGMDHTKSLHRGERKKSWVSAVQIGSSLSPGGSSPNVLCIT